MRLKLRITSNGFSASSDGITVFRHNASHSATLCREIKRAFKDGDEIDALTLLNIIKALQASRQSPQFLVKLVRNRITEGGYANE